MNLWLSGERLCFFSLSTHICGLHLCIESTSTCDKEGFSRWIDGRKMIHTPRVGKKEILNHFQMLNFRREKRWFFWVKILVGRLFVFWVVMWMNLNLWGSMLWFVFGCPPPSLIQWWMWLNRVFVIDLLSRAGIGYVSVAPTRGWSWHTSVRVGTRHVRHLFCCSCLPSAAFMKCCTSAMSFCLRV